MSLLIKDMKMPENCYECLLFDRYDYCCNAFTYGIPARYRHGDQGRPEWCELVEVKTPHGRLIDADELFDKMRCSNWRVSFYHDGTFLDISEFADIIRNIQPVIEAECEP